MTRVTRVTVDRSCAICERTLLMGEQAIRFSPNGGVDYVDVCPLCADTAIEYGWVREGCADVADACPPSAGGADRSWLQTLLGTRPRGVEHDGRLRADPAPAVRAGARDGRGGRSLQRLAVPPHGRRHQQVARRRRSVSVVALSGVNAEVVVTVAWDISLVPVPRLAGLRQSGPPRRARPRPRAARGRRSRAGTPTWAKTAGSSRTSPGCSLDWRSPRSFV